MYRESVVNLLVIMTFEVEISTSYTVFTLQRIEISHAQITSNYQRRTIDNDDVTQTDQALVNIKIQTSDNTGFVNPSSAILLTTVQNVFYQSQRCGRFSLHKTNRYNDDIT